MNLSDPFKQLMERRLWPVALLLVAALVAVPMVLKDDGSTTVAPLPAPAVAQGAGPDPDDSVVALADGGRTDEVRSVLGDRKDPFRPAQIDNVPKQEATGESASKAATDAATEAALGGGGGAAGGDAAAPGATVAPEPTVEPAPEPKPTFELYSLVAKFGEAGGARETKVIERLTGLPGGNPAVLYLGLLENRKAAAFLVDESVEVTGDGKCLPSPEDCQNLTLEVGDTEFFTIGDKSYQLDLRKILTEKTFDREKAEAAKRDVAKGGKALERELGASDEFEYSEETGTVARVARSAKASTAEQVGRAFRGAALDTSG